MSRYAVVMKGESIKGMMFIGVYPMITATGVAYNELDDIIYDLEHPSLVGRLKDPKVEYDGFSIGKLDASDASDMIMPLYIKKKGEDEWVLYAEAHLLEEFGCDRITEDEKEEEDEDV